MLMWITVWLLIGVAVAHSIALYAIGRILGQHWDAMSVVIDTVYGPSREDAASAPAGPKGPAASGAAAEQ